MIKKSRVIKAIKITEEILKDVNEPEKSLSFPVVLGSLLREFIPPTEAEKGGDSGAKMESSNDKKEESYSRLSGGIRLLLSEGFLKEGKAQGEIFTELKRQGYNYPKTSLPRILGIFVQKRIITRYPGEGGQYRYFERK